jgi:hypothetical protein
VNRLRCHACRAPFLKKKTRRSTGWIRKMVQNCADVSVNLNETRVAAVCIPPKHMGRSASTSDGLINVANRCAQQHIFRFDPEITVHFCSWTFRDRRSAAQLTGWAGLLEWPTARHRPTNKIGPNVAPVNRAVIREQHPIAPFLYIEKGLVMRAIRASMKRDVLRPWTV